MTARNRRGVVVLGIVAVLAGHRPPALSTDRATSLTLARAVQIALEESPLLKAARYQVEAADASVDQARAGFLPKLDFDESFTRSDNPVFSFSSKLNQGRFTQNDFAIDSLNSPDPVNNFRTSFSLVQPLYTGGKTTIGLERAKLARDATAVGRDRRRQEVVFEVARAYFGVLLAEAQVASVAAAIRAAEANRQLAEARFAAGLVVESDVLAADVRLAGLKEQAIVAENRLTLARAGLNEVMGRSLDEAVEMAERLTLRPVRSGAASELEGLALGRRPDYQRVALEARAAERAVALAQAEYLPTLNGKASYELNRLDLADNGQGSWFVGVVLQWNIFNGLGDRARVAESRARSREWQALQTSAASRIRLEVKEALLHLRAASERIEVARRAVAQAEESLRIFKDRYEAGLAAIFDLLGSEAALTQAQGNVTRALYDQNVGVAALELALGTIDPASF